jgi:hypothetical protein
VGDYQAAMRSCVVRRKQRLIGSGLIIVPEVKAHGNLQLDLHRFVFTTSGRSGRSKPPLRPSMPSHVFSVLAFYA